MCNREERDHVKTGVLFRENTKGVPALVHYVSARALVSVTSRKVVRVNLCHTMCQLYLSVPGSREAWG